MGAERGFKWLDYMWWLYQGGLNIRWWRPTLEQPGVLNARLETYDFSSEFCRSAHFHVWSWTSRIVFVLVGGRVLRDLLTGKLIKRKVIPHISRLCYESTFVYSAGPQISCFPPSNFTIKQASYVDTYCWDSLMHHEFDSDGNFEERSLWVHKVSWEIVIKLT